MNQGEVRSIDRNHNTIWVTTLLIRATERCHVHRPYATTSYKRSMDITCGHSLRAVRSCSGTRVLPCIDQLFLALIQRQPFPEYSGREWHTKRKSDALVRIAKQISAGCMLHPVNCGIKGSYLSASTSRFILCSRVVCSSNASRTRSSTCRKAASKMLL